MKKIFNLKNLYFVLAVICALVIFILSAQNLSTSGALSQSVTDALNEDAKTGLSDETVRSIAHFSLFFLLGVFVSLFFGKCKFKFKFKFLWAFTVCVLYAVTDEIHQEFFVDGRAFEFIDLAKDWSGSFIGVLLGGRISKIVVHMRQR